MTAIKGVGEKTAQKLLETAQEFLAAQAASAASEAAEDKSGEVAK
ncbi:MAG: hypothetical protein HYY57_02160 [Candidatus Omnitrophica bacterium]|nr:hypothetical protein [Candidatus Omnitrophota bacterium]